MDILVNVIKNTLSVEGPIHIQIGIWTIQKSTNGPKANTNVATNQNAYGAPKSITNGCHKVTAPMVYKATKTQHQWGPEVNHQRRL